MNTPLTAAFPMHRLLFALLAAAFTPPLATAAGMASFEASVSLRAVIDRAALLDPALRTLDARAGEIDASRAVAASLFPAPPTVSTSLRRDRPDRDLGKNEVEFEVGVPLWLPGQRALRERLAAGEGGDRDGALGDARLQLAGQVREALWQVAFAQVEHSAARRRVETVQRVVADVQRRVDRGVLARTDLLLVQSEAVIARALVIDTGLQVDRALQAWHALTGESALPAHYVELVTPAVVTPTDSPAHPTLLAAAGQVALARARLDLASEVNRDPPEIALQHRSDRDVSGAEYRNSVRVALRIPLSTDARNRPRIAAANTELIRVQSGALQARRRLDADQARAQAEFDAALAQRVLAGDRQRIAAEHLSLIERAFDLGEQSLVVLLRAGALAHEADADLTRQSAARDRAVARLNQAAGVMP